MIDNSGEDLICHRNKSRDGYEYRGFTLTSYLIPFRELPDRAVAFARHDDFGL